MEVHVQPRTRSKMFCGCATDHVGQPPNSVVCEICLGMPGVLPVINKQAVELCLRAALALNCEIPRHTKFDRKNYFYPDLPKGYQISQYDLPMSRDGWLELDGRRVGIRRVHLEEDTGRLVHAGDQIHLAVESYVDLNRAGVPLMEIVSEPDLRSAEQAKEFAQALRTLLRYLAVSEADMEKGQMRVEPNVSVRRTGSGELGVKTELKNINSFRSVQRAVDYEVRRQVDVLEAGGQVVQETRGWSEAEQRTVTQRGKEYAEDYRYFPEPDLPPLELDPAWIQELRASLPELPAARAARFRSQFSLSAYDADQLSEERPRADYFEELVSSGVDAKLAANWLIGELRDPAARPSVLSTATVLKTMVSGAINRDQARDALADVVAGATVEAALAGRSQVSDEEELGAVVERVLAENPQAVRDFRAGKQKAIGALVGKVKQATGGKANLKLAGDLLRKRLGG